MIIYTLGHVIFGAYFVYSGFNHFRNEKSLIGYAKSIGVPYPRMAVIVTGIMLLLGGLGFLLNMNIQESAAILLIFMVPTTFKMHAFWKITDPIHKMNEKISFTKNLALIGAILMAL